LSAEVSLQLSFFGLQMNDASVLDGFDAKAEQVDREFDLNEGFVCRMTI